jgi:mannosyltransferase
LFNIGDKSLWFDEGFSAMVASGNLRSIYDVARHYDKNMPGYHIVLHLWRVLGDNESWLRGLSALAIAAGVLVVVSIGRRLFGARVGLLAGLFLAVAPLAVHYAQQLRSYGLLVLFVSLSSYFFVRGVEQPGWIPWSAYALTSSFLVYLHLFGALIIVAHATSLLFLDRSNRPGRYLCVTAAAIGVLLLPLALLAVFGPPEPSWIHPPTLHSVAAVVSHVGGGRVLAVVLSVLCGTAVWVAVRRWRGDGASLRTWRLAFAVLWLLVPFGALLVVSLLVQPVFVDRYLIITLPAVALVAAFGVTLLRTAWRVPTVLAVVALSVIGVVDWYRAPSHEEWRSAVAYVLRDARSADGIVFCAPWTRPAFEYYALRGDPKSRPIPVSPATRWRTGLNDRPPVPASQWPPHVPRIWVIRAYEDPASITPGCNLTSSMQGRSLSRDRTFRGVRVQRYDATS